MQKRYIFSGLVAFCCALFSIKAEPAASPEESGSKQSPDMIKSDLNPDPRMVSGTLPNGLRYYIRPNAEPKGRLSVRMRANVGSLCETESERGISHFLEHMVFAGSKHFGIDQVVPTLQKKGLMFGRDINAYTSFDETVYMADLPDKKEETIDIVMKLMRDFADGALFDSKRLDRERGVILNELKTRDSADYRVMKQELGFLFDGTNLVNRLPIGLEEVIEKTPRETFVDYYTRHYAADQLSLAIVGDITVEEGEKWVKDYFSSIKPSGIKSLPNRGVLKEQTKVRAKIIDEPEVPVTNISLSNVEPYVELPDSAANRLKDLPLEMAMSMFNRRLEILKKKEDCPFLRAEANATDVLRTVRQIAVGATCEPAKWKESLELVEQELRKAVKYGFTPDEFEEAKQKLAQSADQSVETWQTIPSNDLADGILQSVGDSKVFTDPVEDRRILIPALDKLNAKICSEALAREWKPGKTQILLTGTIAIPKGEEEILSVYDQSARTEVSAPAERKVASFAYDKVGDPGKVEQKNKVEDLDFVQMMLSNGVRVNYKKTDFESNTIQLIARVNGGLITMPSDKPGMPLYTRAIMNGGGLAAHNNDDLERLMAGRNVNVNFGISEDSFHFSGSTNKKDLEMELKLICAFILHPGYNQEADVLFKRSLPALYERMDRDSASVLQKNLGRILTGGDYRFAFPRQEKLTAYTPADVKAWVAGPLQKNALELDIIGDFDPSELEAALLRTVAAMPARDKDRSLPPADDLKVKFNPFGGTDVLTYPTTLDKSMTCVVWKGFDGKDKSRKIKLEFLRQILGVKLFDEIRDKMSDAYSPQGRMEASDYYDGYGYFVALSPGTSENSERVGNAIRAMGDNLAKGEITEDDMDRIREPFLATFEKAQRENDYWLNGALVNSQYEPEKLDRFRSVIGDIRKITLNEIKALAAEIFTSPNSVLIRVVPAPPENGKNGSGAAKGGDTTPASTTARYTETPGQEGYAVLISEETAKDKEWMAVADKLLEAYKGKPFF